MIHMDYWRRELATRLRNTAPFQLFHVITLTLALDAASHLPSGLKEQCKIAATARAGKKKSPRNDGVHQRGLNLSRLHTLNTGMATEEVATSKWEEEAKGREKPNRNKQTKKIMWQLQRLSIRKRKQSKTKNKWTNNLLEAYCSFRLFTAVNGTPTNPFSWEQYLFMWAVRMEQGGVAQASEDADMQSTNSAFQISYLSKYKWFFIVNRVQTIVHHHACPKLFTYRVRG